MTVWCYTIRLMLSIYFWTYFDNELTLPRPRLRLQIFSWGVFYGT
jgi:hypothetical protein